MIPAPEPWMADAVCAQTDPDLFFPDRGSDSRAARALCASCPVVEECLEYALERYESGIWGGTSEKQRQQMRKDLKACA